MNTYKNIIEFAKENGYETAEYLGEYKGNKCYEAIYRNDGEIYIVGLPAFILEKSEQLEWIQNEKSFEILNCFYPDEE